jgi:predicted RNase H-like nuclease (RuvC/YqgF family)
MSNDKKKHENLSRVDDALLDELFRSAASDAAILDGRAPGLLSERPAEKENESELAEEKSEIERLEKLLESEKQLNDALKVRVDELQEELESLHAELEAAKKHTGS